MEEFYQVVKPSTSAVSSINLRIDTHPCKLRDVPVARFYTCTKYYILNIYDSSGCHKTGQFDHYLNAAIASYSAWYCYVCACISFYFCTCRLPGMLLYQEYSLEYYTCTHGRRRRRDRPSDGATDDAGPRPPPTINRATRSRDRATERHTTQACKDEY